MDDMSVSELVLNETRRGSTVRVKRPASRTNTDYYFSFLLMTITLFATDREVDVRGSES